jgi:uncharacterized protein (DUF488 family)
METGEVDRGTEPTMAQAATLYSIGHSTRTWSEFAELLAAHGIQMLVDVRRFPASRRLPHFGREVMQAALREIQIEYQWWPALGGRRSRRLRDSPNLGLRSLSFRNYADYMLEDEFREAAEALLAAGKSRRLAYMCAEALYFRCHRMLISDWLILRGARVLHIQTAAAPKPHVPTAGAMWTGSGVLYPPPQMELAKE